MIHSIPQPGDIGLTSINGPVGWAIRAGQWLLGDGSEPFEHAFIVLDDGQLVEAMPGGARIAPLDEYHPRPPLGMVVPRAPHGGNTIYVSPQLTPGQRVLIVAAARALVGTPYSGLDYAAIAAHRFRLPLPGLRRYIGTSGHMICSQLADQAYADAGVHLFADGRWPGYVTPADLYNVLARDGGQR